MAQQHSPRFLQIVEDARGRIREVSVDDVKTSIDRGENLVLLDVREESEYARDHIRLSTQPLERPENKQQLWDVLAAMDGENVLMYASDYPHWDFDAPDQLHLPKEWLPKIMDANARQVYTRLPPLATPAQAALAGPLKP